MVSHLWPDAQALPRNGTMMPCCVQGMKTVGRIHSQLCSSMSLPDCAHQRCPPSAPGLLSAADQNISFHAHVCRALGGVRQTSKWSGIRAEPLFDESAHRPTTPWVRS